MSLLQSAIDLLMDRASSEGTDKYTPGVAVLKAAEKVDKQDALWAIIHAEGPLLVHLKPYRSDKTFEDWKKYMIKIEALLEALPDEE